MKKWIILILLLCALRAEAQTVPEITWTNDRGGSGTATGSIANWTISNIPLGVGINNICATMTNASGGKAQDCIAWTRSQTHPGDAMVLALGFEEGGGLTATDSSGANNPGFLRNGAARTTTGKYGSGISLDGVDDHILVADSNSLDISQGFTVSMWVFPTQVQTTFKSIFYKALDSQSSTIQFFASITYTCAPGGVGVWVNTNGNIGPNTEACDGTALPVNQWTHLAATYDGANIKLYKNGALIKTVAKTGLIAPNTADITIGASEFPGEYFKGTIDEVRYYNYAIPISAGSNTVPGAACVFGDPLNTSQQSIIRDMNCPVIQLPTTPPVPIQLPASATGLKIGPGASALKFGSKTP